MLEMQELISGRYRLQQRLCHGGMSDVYLAYDELMHRDVAIKLVSSDNTENIHRLHREIQAMSILLHDHILPTLDYGTHGSYHYLVMPYMRRGNLRERIAQGSLTQEEAGNILAQIASALQLAHDHRILHRDIKPSNILLDNSDERHVYLADFGLAKVIGEGSDITQTGCLIGTPEYMAPELANSPESVSSDIYALGVLLYQMLAGRPPFRQYPSIGLLEAPARATGATFPRQSGYLSFCGAGYFACIGQGPAAAFPERKSDGPGVCKCARRY